MQKKIFKEAIKYKKTKSLFFTLFFTSLTLGFLACGSK